MYSPIPTRIGLTVLLVAAGAAHSFPPSAAAAVVVSPLTGPADRAGFAETATGAGLLFLGRETFSSLGEGESGTTPGAILAPGISAGNLFPSGSDAALGLLFQTNSLGDSPSVPSPGGVLFASGPGDGRDYAAIGPDLAANSLDILVDPPGYRGLVQGLAFAVAATGESPVVVRVYDNENALLAMETLTGPDLRGVSLFSDTGPIFRVNLHAPTGYIDVGEGDLYAVPEPAAAAGLFGLAVLFLAIRRRRGRPQGG